MLSHRGNGAGKLVSGRCWSIERGRTGGGAECRLARLARCHASHLFSPAALEVRTCGACERGRGNGGVVEVFGGGGGAVAFHVCKMVCEICEDG